MLLSLTVTSKNTTTNWFYLYKSNMATPILLLPVVFVVLVVLVVFGVGLDAQTNTLLLSNSVGLVHPTKLDPWNCISLLTSKVAVGTTWYHIYRTMMQLIWRLWPRRRLPRICRLLACPDCPHGSSSDYTTIKSTLAGVAVTAPPVPALPGSPAHCCSTALRCTLIFRFQNIYVLFKPSYTSLHAWINYILFWYY